MEKTFRPKFLDKEIIEMRKEKLKEQYKSLTEGVYMDGEIRDFERQDILNTISVMLPKDFIMMPEDYAQIKYTSFRPQHLITDKKMNVNIGFSLFPNNLKNKNVQRVAEQIREVLDSEEAGLNFGMCKKLENLEAWWFDFRSHSMDSDVYNILLVIIVNHKILKVVGNCKIQDELDWKPVFLQIFESIEPIKEEV